MTGNLLIVMPSLRRGGAERHSLLLALNADRRAWDPHVLAFAGGPLQSELEGAGIAVTVADTGTGLRAIPQARAVLNDTLDRLSPAVVSAHDVFVELAVRSVAIRRPLPLLVWKHTYGHIGYRGVRERVIEGASGALVTRYGAVCHTQVRYLTDELHIDPRRIRVVQNTVATSPASDLVTQPDIEPTVAMVAAMRADKGHRSALQAWSIVRRDHPDAQLLLAGDGPLRPELEQLAGDLEIEKSVYFAGEVAEPDTLVRRADLLLLASYSIECFPYVGLEAMALSRPIVSTNVGGLPEMIDDGVTGALVPPHDPVALADALNRALADRAHTAAQGRAAYDRLRTVFPFTRWQRQINELLDEVADAAVGKERS